MGDWRELFKPWIVERGRDYFSGGHVVELEEEGFFVCAKVSGSQEYQVEIRSNSDGVLRMACDCPYAERGENCKHMAAVLFALEDVPEQWRTDLEQILLKHSDYRGDIVYGHEYHCLADLAQYLEDSLPYLLIDGQVMEAVQLVFNVYDTAFGETLSNDDSGGHDLVSQACRNAFEQILSKADDRERRKIFDLLHEFLEGSE